METKFVKLPQTGLLIDIDQIYMIGQVEPGKFVAFMKGSNQGGFMLPGDHAALYEEIKRRGLVQELEIPAGMVPANDGGTKEEPAKASVEGRQPTLEVAKA